MKRKTTFHEAFKARLQTRRLTFGGRRNRDTGGARHASTTPAR
jgi:hypothetical protein